MTSSLVWSADLWPVWDKRFLVSDLESFTEAPPLSVHQNERTSFLQQVAPQSIYTWGNRQTGWTESTGIQSLANESASIRWLKRSAVTYSFKCLLLSSSLQQLAKTSCTRETPDAREAWLKHKWSCERVHGNKPLLLCGALLFVCYFPPEFQTRT